MVKCKVPGFEIYLLLPQVIYIQEISSWKEIFVGKSLCGLYQSILKKKRNCLTPNFHDLIVNSPLKVLHI